MIGGNVHCHTKETDSTPIYISSQKGKKNYSPLKYPFLNYFLKGHTECVKVLIEAGANINFARRDKVN